MESTETALATKETKEQAGEQSWEAVNWLPCELTLDLAVPKFRVGDLLRLKERDLVDTGWAQGKDIPLRVNGRVIAWSEFEVVGEKLSLRLTELA